MCNKLNWTEVCYILLYILISHHPLVSGMYLVVITKRKKVGDLLGHAVWKALDFDIISYKKTILHLTDNQARSYVFLWFDLELHNSAQFCLKYFSA